MKRILLLLGLGALFTAFFINIGGVDLLPDWLGSLFFALGVTGLGRRGGESLSTPAMIAWVLFVTEMVSVLLRPEGMFAVGIGVLFVILEVWLYLLVAGILDERFPEEELSIRPISILGVVSAVGYVMTMAFGSGTLGVLCLLTGGCHEGLVHGTARQTLQNRGGLKNRVKKTRKQPLPGLLLFPGKTGGFPFRRERDLSPRLLRRSHGSEPASSTDPPQ